MSPEEQARLLQDMKDQFIRSVADLLTLKARVDRARTNGKAENLPHGTPTMGEYLLDLSRLSVSFYQSVLDLNASYWEKVANAIPDEKRKAARGENKDAPAPIKQKAVVSADQEHVTFDVEIENTSGVEGTYSFVTSKFRAMEKGVEPVLAAVKIVPPRPSIRAGAKERMRIVVPVAGVFAAGQKYKCRISVRGPTESEIVLRVKVEDRADRS